MLVDTSHSLVLLLLSLPAAAAVLLVLPSSSVFTRLRPYLCACALLGAALGLAVLGARGSASVRLPLWPTGSGLSEPLALSLDPLSQLIAMAFVGGLALVAMARLEQGIDRSQSVIVLLLAAGAFVVCTARNLLTLCLGWALTDVALLGLDIMHVPDEGISHAVRTVLANLLSTIALVASTVLALLHQGSTEIPTATADPTVFRLLVSAALLRLGLFPLPGSTRRRWEAYLAALCTGGYLWLRVAMLQPDSLHAAEGWAIFLLATMVATSLLAGLARDFALALPYLLLRGIATLVLAPLLDPIWGYPIALVILVNLCLCLVLLRIDAQIRPARPWRRRARLPLAVGLASLLGFPITLGFVGHWALLRLLWQKGSPGLATVGMISSLLCGITAWQRLRVARQEVIEGDLPGRRNLHLAVGCATVLALSSVGLGLFPALLGDTWPAISDRLWPVSFGRLISGPLPVVLVCTVGVILLPIGGSFALSYLIRVYAPKLGWLLTVPSALLELDWLYAGIEAGLARIWHLGERAILLVEEGLYLGWTLIWILVVVLYLTGR